MLWLWGVNMCLICVEFQKGKLSPFEAKRNLREMHSSVGVDHVLEALKLIEDVDDLEKVKDGPDLEWRLNLIDLQLELFLKTNKM